MRHKPFRFDSDYINNANSVLTYVYLFFVPPNTFSHEWVITCNLILPINSTHICVVMF